jgi:hypothetical protein
MPPSVTIPAIAARNPTTHFSAWRPILPTSGMLNSAPENAGTWDGSREVLDTSFANVPPEIRELRVRADAGFGFNPVFVGLEQRPAQYAVVARLIPAFKRLLSGVSYEPVNRKWEITEFEHRPHGWPKARRFVVARRFIQQEEAETTLFAMGRYIYRA